MREHRIELLGISELFNNLGVLSQTIAFSLGPVAIAQTIGSTQPLIVLSVVLLLHYSVGYSLDEEISKSTIIVKAGAGVITLLGVYLTLI